MKRDRVSMTRTVIPGRSWLLHWAGIYDLAPGAVCVELTAMLAMHYDDDDIDAWKGVYEPRHGHR